MALVSIVLSTVHYRNICIIKRSWSQRQTHRELLPTLQFSQLYEVVQPSVSSLFGFPFHSVTVLSLFTYMSFLHNSQQFQIYSLLGIVDHLAASWMATYLSHQTPECISDVPPDLKRDSKWMLTLRCNCMVFGKLFSLLTLKFALSDWTDRLPVLPKTTYTIVP